MFNGFRKILLSCTFCFVGLPLMLLDTGCENQPTSDMVQAARQENVTAELASQMGMPSIKNGAEMRLLKLIYEMRDQNKATYAYTYSDYHGKFRFLGNTIGFGIPYAAQYSAPTKLVWRNNGGWHQVPQSEPNGIFMPSSAEGTWILMKNPTSSDVVPVYIEPRIAVFPFKLPASVVVE
jgi:hypothetical protein